MSGVQISVGSTRSWELDDLIRRYKTFEKTDDEKLDELRGWLMVLASLTASVTYSAGLDPPGGFWQADDAVHGYVAGNPVLLDKSRIRYMAFHYFNLTSFATSLCIIVLLSISKIYYRTQAAVFSSLVVLDILCLLGAFAAGSIFNTPSSIYSSITLFCVVICLLTFGIVFGRERTSVRDREPPV